MWQKLMKQHPVIFEAINWAVLALSAGAFALALAVYMGWGPWGA